MRLTELPTAERPRERLLRSGAAALADAELLAIFLRTGTRGASAIELAQQLLARRGGLAGLAATPPQSLAAEPGVGTAKACMVAAAVELARRALEAPLRREAALSDPRAGAAYVRAWLRPYPYEVFGALFLDNRHRVIAAEELFRGTIDGASVHPREVVRRAIAHNAAALIAAHNHPSGVAEPSAADIAITRRLADALALVDVRLLDHFIVGDGEPVSLATRGLL
jgi:DNA repair protein RadC